MQTMAEAIFSGTSTNTVAGVPLEFEKLQSEKLHWETKCHHLVDEVNRRGFALSEHLLSEAALKKENIRLAAEFETLKQRCHYLEQHQSIAANKHSSIIRKLKDRIKAQQEHLKYLSKVRKSAIHWQSRSWLKRAFHRWKAPARV